MNHNVTPPPDIAPLFKFPSRSSAFEAGPVIALQGAGLIFRYDEETESGAVGWRELTFEGVIAFRFVDDPSCTEEQVGAYHQLVEVEPSAWLHETFSMRRTDTPTKPRHFRIYVDDVGCFEVLAQHIILPG